ncbi:MAG: ketoacyl-ACP synthase III [Proteobacteria bacterium]|nr:ketoacyl-ACP synthase III [Pseudomonadota bacterium]
MHSRIVGTGRYLPRRILTNQDLARSVDTSDEWIRSMTGIRQRHIAGDGESTAEMGVLASREALSAAGMNASEMDLIIVATITPDLVFPSTAALVQARLGARNVGCLDLSAACSGFLFALATADAMISAGRCRSALVIGSERMSKLLDWRDRGTCVLFGDGAGAVVLVASDEPGVRTSSLHADGSMPEVLRTPAVDSPYLHMDGPVVFKFAVKGFVEAGEASFAENGMQPRDLDWLIPHQANLRIIEASSKRLQIDRARVVVTVDRHANTSAASIPMALDEAVRDRRIISGNRILLLSVGGGFTWGSCMLDWRA